MGYKNKEYFLTIHVIACSTTNSPNKEALGIIFIVMLQVKYLGVSSK